MAVDVKGGPVLSFNESQDVVVTLATGSAINNPSEIEFQDHGLMVHWTTPGDPSGSVHHYKFVPYSNLLNIGQDYLEV